MWDCIKKKTENSPSVVPPGNDLLFMICIQAGDGKYRNNGQIIQEKITLIVLMVALTGGQSGIKTAD